MPIDPDRVVSALQFAATLHGAEDQRVPGTDLPYLLHLGSVATEMMLALNAEPATDGELSVLCAVLHDAIEDTAATYEQVAEQFGSDVADGVAALTKDGALPKSDRMADSLRRIRLQPHAVWKVKLADRITNLQPPPAHWSRDKCLKYQAEARDILAALGDASPHLAARMAAKIEAYSDHLP